MIPVQPTLNINYFQFRKNNIPKGVKYLFYLSWEDALWDILIHKKIKKGSKILLPDFYCIDVEENIRKHGYEIVHYNILLNLDADKKSFEQSLIKYKPAIVVIFHPVGIKSNLLSKRRWLKEITGDSILIEDSVHRILSSEELNIVKKNHYIIDSLRKVLPLQGSRLFGSVDDLNFEVPSVFQSFLYRTKVNFFWFLMVVCWTMGLGRMAEKVMIKGYEIIGDSIKPSRGGFLFKILSSHIDFRNIQNIRVKQINYYEKKFGKILSIKLKIKKNDKKHLRGYPIILPAKNADNTLNHLRSHGLLVRFELDGCKWSEKQKIIYLPLGLQINKSDQKTICRLVAKSFKLHQAV